MRYFYIFILTLILISCNDKKGYGGVKVDYGDKINVTDEDECRKVLEKGKIISSVPTNSVSKTYFISIILYKNYLYRVNFRDDYHYCEWKQKFHNK